MGTEIMLVGEVLRQEALLLRLSRGPPHPWSLIIIGFLASFRCDTHTELAPILVFLLLGAALS